MRWLLVNARCLSEAWRAALLSTIALLCFSPSSCHSAPTGWNLTWSDEFEGSQVDTTKWDPILWTTPFNNERQAYHPSRVTVSEGNLVLTADDADFGGKTYTSGKVESKFTQRHGRWEIRAKLPGTQGTWPAIWLLPDTSVYPWPSQGEIDIMENRGNQPNLTSSAFHWGANFQTRQFRFEEQQATNGGQLENFHDEFHTYAVEWDDTKLRFFVDDVHYQTITDEQVGGFLSSQTAPVEINLNVAVGGDFLGGAQPNGGSVWPQQMLIDYVRVYEREGSPSPIVFKNGSFEQQGGSLAGWTTFGNELPNVGTHHEATALDGSETLKMYGQFRGVTNYSGIAQGISVSGGDDLEVSANSYVRAADDLIGENRVEMKIDYYSDFGGEFGSPSYLGSSDSVLLADADSANDAWHPHSLTDTAPAGAVEARLAFVFTQEDNAGGAVHIDDVHFRNLDLDLNANADHDSNIDGADFLAWQQGLGRNDGTAVSEGDFNYDGVVDGLDLEVWTDQFGDTATLGSLLQVPEPSTLVSGVISLLTLISSPYLH